MAREPASGGEDGPLGEKEKTELVDDAVRAALSPELEEGARDAGLPPEEIVERAKEQVDDIFAPVERQAERWEEAKKAHREIQPDSESGSPGAAFRLMVPRRRVIRAAIYLPLLLAAAYFLWPFTTVEWVIFGYLTFGGLITVFARDLNFTPDGELDSAASEERVRATERAFQDALIEEGAGPWLRQQVNAASDRSYSTYLTFQDAAGLAEVNDVDASTVTTQGQRRVEELMNVMPGGTIGIAGSRGVGKTTLIGDLCTRQAAAGDGALGVVVDAPVRYDGREFALHLFGRVCEAVLGPSAVRQLRAGYSTPDRPLSAWLQTPAMLLISGLALLVFGVDLIVPDVAASERWIGAFLVAAGSLLGALGIRLLERERRERLRRAALFPAPGEADGANATAIRHLKEIWFQQSFSSGWSGSLSLPLGLEGGVEAGWELAQQQLSFPDVVARLRDFLEIVTPQQRVVVGIDELDKMDEETARTFLNEIKAVFRVKGCFFVVSVSDDAMTDFESRGISFRDVFDSSFDEVVSLDHFSFDDSRELLADRVVGLPLPFVALAHVLSGGLPRELIRVTRSIVRLPKRTSLSQATRILGANALQVHARAVEHQLTPMKDENGLADIVAWMRRAWTEDQSLGRLREWCGEMPELSVHPSPALDLCLLAQFTLATIELFDRIESDEEMREVLDGVSEGSPVERLTEARRGFAVSRTFALSLIEECRVATDV